LEKGDVETTSEEKENIIIITELLNTKEINRLFKHLKQTLDKSEHDNIISTITELNNDLTSYISTSEKRKQEERKAELLRKKKEIDEELKEIAKNEKLETNKLN
jgi:folylpolyglutamate synthase/dihydropteroate synthase